jgi:RNA polymerase sigma-70 factor (ECF subfamily)
VNFEGFFREQYPLVYRAVLAFCGDKELAADATQEAFVRAYERWGRLGDEPWAGGWTATTALNLTRRISRHSGRRRAVERKETMARRAPEPADWYPVHQALALLPLRQRQVVVLHYFSDLSVAQVAELIHTSEGTVKAHLFRARRTLGENLSASPDSQLSKEADGV